MKYIKFISLFSFAFYMLLVISCFVFSMYFVNESVGFKLKKILADSGCSYVGPVLRPSIFRPDLFYSNLGYWLSDVKLKYGILEDQKCMQVLVNGAQAIAGPVSVVVASDSAKITLLLKFSNDY